MQLPSDWRSEATTSTLKASYQPIIKTAELWTSMKALKPVLETNYYEKIWQYIHCPQISRSTQISPNYSHMQAYNAVASDFAMSYSSNPFTFTCKPWHECGRGIVQLAS